MKIRTAIFLLFVLTLYSCQQNSQQAHSEREQSGVPSYDSLDWSQQYTFGEFSAQDKKYKKSLCEKVFREAWQANNVSAGMLVAQHGQIIYENYTGMADKGRGVELSAETPLHIASTSKVMTALAVLKLVEKNKIGLEDSIQQYFPRFPYHGVTIRHLLSHRSGLPNYLYFMEDKNYCNDQEKMLKNNDVLQAMIENKPPATAAPGKHFSYNNTNFVLLALLIEKRTGMSFPRAMDHILFRPLGMHNTYVFQWPQDSSRAAKSYYFSGKAWKPKHLDGTYGDKNIYSTPRDMFRLDRAMYSDKFLPEALKKEASKGYSYESEGIKNYGLGIRMMEFDDGGKFLYHNGWWHGNNSVYVRDYHHEACIIAFGNKYTRSVYAPFSLVTMFGSYALPVDSSLIQKEDSIRLLQQRQDSVDHAKIRISDSTHTDSSQERTARK